MCNEAWAKYSDGTSIPDSGTTSYQIAYVPLREDEQSAEIPMLCCQNERIERFKFYIITFDDNESHSATDIHFIYGSEDGVNYASSGYLYLQDFPGP